MAAITVVLHLGVYLLSDHRALNRFQELFGTVQGDTDQGLLTEALIKPEDLLGRRLSWCSFG